MAVDMYNLEIYEEGKWVIVCEKRCKAACDYFAAMFLRNQPEAELVIVPAS